MLPVTSEQRRLGKTINFGIIYGMSAFRLSKELDLPVSMAQRYIDNYFARYPKVKGYFSSLMEAAETRGFVTTITGRRREIRELETEGRDRGFMQRVAVNAPIQGSAADLIKIAMIAIEKGIKTQGLSCTLLLQIHDELLFECPEAAVESAKDFIRTTMEGVMKLNVPLLVQTGSGLNWDAAH
jgi:DNA polymerase-1